MSWQLASFLILGAVILGGFAWYERSRPPAQVVALVAALAALAIAGRIAFAAFPNVKPTTDIVVFAGYALGAAPGFAVGALAALVSNFWFGQGPWTPWQMAGWGLCGVFGALLALGLRNAGRLSLAATCALAGAFYGALLNFSLMATYGGDLSLERFGVLQARAIPFDLAHVLGNVAFALLAGPALVRMLIRFRERFEWRRRGGAEPPPPEPGGRRLAPGIGGIAVVLMIALAAVTATPSRAEAAGAAQAAGWLIAQQNDDGGFGASPGDDSGTEMTGWAMLGLEAVGRNPLDVARGGRTPVDYLRGNLADLKSPGDLARTILALTGAGVDPRDFGGANLVSRLLAKRRDDGSYLGWPGSTAFAAIALRAAGAGEGLGPTLSWLRGVQNEDGGWGDLPDSPSTADGTGAAMQALAPDSKAVRRGLSFLRDSQRPGGGFSLGGNGVVNSQSTAWAIQGIVAAGGDVDSFRRGGASALDYLAARQAGDGHYRYSKSSDQTPVWVTGEALVAAAGRSFPLAPPARAPVPQQSAGGGVPPGIGSSGSTPPVQPPPASTAPVIPPGAGGIGGSSGGAGSGAGSAGGPGSVPGSGATAPGIPSGALPPGAETAPAPTPADPGPLVPEEATATSEEGAEDDKSESPFGAIALGLLAGGLLFGAGLGGRRLWMRWRYGI